MKKIILVMSIIIIVLIMAFILQSRGNIKTTNNTNNGTNTEVGNNNDTPVVKSRILNLSNQGLKSIPSDVFSQINIEELNVSNNLLTGAIQAEIRHLSKLKILNASHNQMTGVPAEIGQLQNLEILDLSNNQLTGLPNELGNLKNLKTFNISGNNYSQQDLDYIISKIPKTVNIITN